MQSVLKKHWKRLTVTGSIVIAESVTWILFPLVMGYAIDDIIQGSFTGLIWLAGLGGIALTLGALRRLIDSRTYAKVYESLADIVIRNTKLSTSKKTARVRLLNEIVEFMEESMPELASSMITLVGTIVILAFLDIKIFLGCIALIVIAVVTYWLSSGRTLRLNKRFNDELELQVDTIQNGTRAHFTTHMRKLMRSNIDLSDLETLTFSVVLLASIALIIFSIVVAGQNGLAAGAIFALVTYVFQFIEGLATAPLYYQQILRLSDIARRIKN